MAKKSNKKNNKKAEKVELTESFNKIKNTANKVNAQVLETATEVMDDVKENGKYWVETANQKVKSTIENFDAAESVKAGSKMAKSTAKSVNEFALETADELVDGALANGKRMQKVTAKAIDGGLKLAAKQQDIVFDALETVKGQLAKNTVRFRKIFKAN